MRAASSPPLFPGTHIPPSQPLPLPGPRDRTQHPDLVAPPSLQRLPPRRPSPGPALLPGPFATIAFLRQWSGDVEVPFLSVGFVSPSSHALKLLNVPFNVSPSPPPSRAHSTPSPPSSEHHWRAKNKNTFKRHTLSPQTVRMCTTHHIKQVEDYDHILQEGITTDPHSCGFNSLSF